MSSNLKVPVVLLLEKCAKHDTHYAMSDDPTAYDRGLEDEQQIRKDFKDLSSEERAEVSVIYHTLKTLFHGL